MFVRSKALRIYRLPLVEIQQNLFGGLYYEFDQEAKDSSPSNGCWVTAVWEGMWTLSILVNFCYYNSTA